LIQQKTPVTNKRKYSNLTNGICWKLRKCIVNIGNNSHPSLILSLLFTNKSITIIDYLLSIFVKFLSMKKKKVENWKSFRTKSIELVQFLLVQPSFHMSASLLSIDQLLFDRLFQYSKRTMGFVGDEVVLNTIYPTDKSDFLPKTNSIFSK